MSARDIVRYLVTKRLIGDVVTLLAIKEYLVDGLSPSTIGHRYRISKYRVRGYVQRTVEKVRYHDVAAAIVKAVFPYVMELSPVVLRLDGHYLCLLCDTKLSPERVRQHVIKRHRDYVESLVDEVMRRVEVIG